MHQPAIAWNEGVFVATITRNDESKMATQLLEPVDLFADVFGDEARKPGGHLAKLGGANCRP